MEKVKFTLSDNNFTRVFHAELNLEPRDAEKITSMLSHIQEGLYFDHERHLSIQSSDSGAMDLTVTGCRDC